MGVTYWGADGRGRHETVALAYDGGLTYVSAVAAFHAATVAASCRRCRSGDPALRAFVHITEACFLGDRAEVTFAVERLSDDQEADVAAARDGITALLLRPGAPTADLCAEHAARVAAVWA